MVSPTANRAWRAKPNLRLSDFVRGRVGLQLIASSLVSSRSTPSIPPFPPDSIFSSHLDRAYIRPDLATGPAFLRSSRLPIAPTRRIARTLSSSACFSSSVLDDIHGFQGESLESSVNVSFSAPQRSDTKSTDFCISAGKLSLSTPNTEHDAKQDSSFRAFSAKRFGPEPSQGRSNPFSAMSPGGMVSPTGGGSSAFGLGSGAFASFGSANKNSKPPGAPFDWGKASVSAATPTTPGERRDRPPGVAAAVARKESLTANAADEMRASSATDLSVPWPLKYTWVIWYRPPTPKNSDYEKSTKPLYRAATAQDFWNVLAHLKHPSALPAVSDYHFFKDGIRPVWEDDENKRGGKWIMRLKKGVADRYWEELLMAMIGDQFAEAGDEVCGCVLSVRSGEDVFSVWTKNDGGRNIKIR